MAFHRWRALGAALGLCLSCAALAAEADSARTGGFWGGVDAGAAGMRRSFSITPSKRDTEFAMAFRGGYAWHPRLLLGLELGGWTLQASSYYWPVDEDPKGEGISTFYGIAQYYPVEGSPFFLKGGYGYIKYWNNRIGEDGGSGSGGVLGAGYDIAWTGRWYITPSVELARGSFDDATSPPGITQDQRYRALTFRIGLTYR